MKLGRHTGSIEHLSVGIYDYLSMLAVECVVLFRSVSAVVASSCVYVR